jgi:hypothetical protein
MWPQAPSLRKQGMRGNLASYGRRETAFGQTNASDVRQGLREHLRKIDCDRRLPPAAQTSVRGCQAKPQKFEGTEVDRLGSDRRNPPVRRFTATSDSAAPELIPRRGSQRLEQVRFAGRPLARGCRSWLAVRCGGTRRRILRRTGPPLSGPRRKSAQTGAGVRPIQPDVPEFPQFGPRIQGAL